MEDLKLSGYSAGKELAAQRITRGQRAVYVISLPIELVPVHLTVPDPEQSIPGNRQVQEKHAREFGDYWANRPDAWTVPPLLVDTSGSLEFRRIKGVEGGAEWGVLIIPNNSPLMLRTLDGQHRILGWALKAQELAEKRNTLHSRIREAERIGDREAKARAEAELVKVDQTLLRMQREQVTLEIMTNVSEEEHQLFFVTIADNAKGINQSERTRMDQENLTSIVARSLASSMPLLSGRIEERKATAGRKSKDLLSLANVREIVRHTWFGISGRVTAARENRINEGQAEAVSQNFFRAMTESVPELTNIVGQTYLPSDLRLESLFGSITIWRCLAGTYHKLAVEWDGTSLEWSVEGDQKFRALVASLLPHMKIKDRRLDRRWYKTGLVNEGELSPTSRSQDLRGLTDLFLAWAASGSPFEPPRL